MARSASIRALMYLTDEMTASYKATLDEKGTSMTGTSLEAGKQRQQIRRAPAMTDRPAARGAARLTSAGL